jgi:hypothetical protein
MIDREQVTESLKMLALSCSETGEKINDIRKKIEAMGYIES